MKELLDRIDSKLITSVGGILLSFFLGYALYQIATAQYSALAKNVQQLDSNTRDSQSKLSETLAGVTKALNENTQAVRDLQILIRQR